MRLCFVSHEYPPYGGGAATALEAYSKTLAVRGHIISVVTCGSSYSSMQISNQLSITHLPANRKKILTPGYLEIGSSYWSLKKHSPAIIKSFQPDAVICFFAFPAGHALAKYLKKENIPFILSIRGSDAPGFWSPRSRHIQKVINHLSINTLRLADGVFCNGNNLSRLVEPYVEKARLISIPNGVDREIFYPADIINNDSNIIRLLFVGQFIHRKRCLELTRAVSRLIKEGHKNISLKLIGSGPLEKTLQNIARDEVNNLSIMVLPGVPRKKMGDIYRNHSALALFSEAEGVSNVALEASASGIPVLSCATALDSSLINITKLLAEDSTEESIYNLLKQVVENPHILKTLRGKTIVKSSAFGWEKSCEQFEAWVKNIIHLH